MMTLKQLHDGLGGVYEKKERGLRVFVDDVVEDARVIRTENGLVALSIRGEPYIFRSSALRELIDDADSLASTGGSLNDYTLPR